MHGGKGGRPIVSGRYSKHLPQRLAADFEAAKQDAELLSLSDSLALIESRICEVLGSLDHEESSLAWKAAMSLYTLARSESDPGKQEQAMSQLGEILRHGFGEVQKWQELFGMMEQRRKLSETEGRRLAAMQQNITAQQANVLIAAVLSSINTNVVDPDARKRIAQDLIRLAHPGGGELAVPN